MNELFHPFLDRFLVVYLNHIIVYSQTLEKHIEHQKTVFHLLRVNQLHVKREKCSFDQEEVYFSKYWIRYGHIWIDCKNMKAMQERETPSKATELQSFLNLVS